MTITGLNRSMFFWWSMYLSNSLLEKKITLTVGVHTKLQLISYTAFLRCRSLSQIVLPCGLFRTRHVCVPTQTWRKKKSKENWSLCYMKASISIFNATNKRLNVPFADHLFQITQFCVYTLHPTQYKSHATHRGIVCMMKIVCPRTDSFTSTLVSVQNGNWKQLAVKICLKFHIHALIRPWITKLAFNDRAFFFYDTVIWDRTQSETCW